MEGSTSATRRPPRNEGPCPSSLRVEHLSVRTPWPFRQPFVWIVHFGDTIRTKFSRHPTCLDPTCVRPRRHHPRRLLPPRKSVDPCSLLGSRKNWEGSDAPQPQPQIACIPARRRFLFLRRRQCCTPIRLPLALPLADRLMERSGVHRYATPGVWRRPGLWGSRSGRAQRTCGPPRHGENRSICDWNMGVTIYR